MSHFTYQDFDSEHLKQGDLLKRTPEIDNIIRDIHPHFQSPDYIFFMVLTQSCDLDRNRKNCKYINIAVVRTLSSILEREAERYYTNEKTKKIKLLNLNKKSKFEDFLNKLLNNNLNEYFYLHKDIDNKLSDSYVVNLRVSISLKANEHYKTCLDAKFLELKDEFKAKLGWLVGNLYSRVATQDWIPNFKNENDFKSMIVDILEDHFIFKTNINIILDELAKIKSESELETMKRKEIFKIIDEIKIPDNRTKVLTRLNHILEKSKLIEKNNIPNISSIIINDGELKSLMKNKY